MHRDQPATKECAGNESLQDGEERVPFSQSFCVRFVLIGERWKERQKFGEIVIYVAWWLERKKRITTWTGQQEPIRADDRLVGG